MKIRAAKAECGDRGATRISASDPGTQLGIDVKRSNIQPAAGVGAINMQGRRQYPMTQRHGHLDQTGDTGSTLGMADVGFDTAYRNALVRQVMPAQQAGQRRTFGTIPYHGTRTVRLEQSHRGRAVSGLGISPFQRALLPILVRRRQTLLPAVRTAGNALDNRVNLVAVTLGIIEPLEDYGGVTLAGHDTVRVCIEGTRTPGRRQGTGLAETQVAERILRGVTATGNHHIAGPDRQFTACQVK